MNFKPLSLFMFSWIIGCPMGESMQSNNTKCIKILLLSIYGSVVISAEYIVNNSMEY